MTRFTKSANGKYMVQGTNYEVLIGSRAQVWHGTAYKTAGGLTKSHLMQNKSGRIVSKAKHNTAKSDNRLVKAGYGTKKGTFGYVKLNSTKSGKRGGGPFSFGTSNSPPNVFKNATNQAERVASRSLKGGRKGGSRKRRGGMHALSPSPYSGKGVGTSGVAVQFVAGNAS